MQPGHMVYSNMTPKEEFRLNGTLCESTIEALILEHEDTQEADIKGAKTYIKEAKGCYASEDFLTTPVRDLQTVANRVRGQNKLMLLDIIQQLQNIENEIRQSGEYGSDELRKALDCLK